MNAPAIQIRPNVPKHVYDPEKDDLIELHGDPNDPGPDGISSTHRFNNASDAKVLLLYQHPTNGDVILECEVYVDPEHKHVTVHMLCPSCRHSLTVPSTKKLIDWDKELGLISIEQSQCTWEEKSDQEVSKATPGLILRSNLCGFRFVVDKNIVRKV